MASPSEHIFEPLKKKTRLYEDVVGRIVGMIEQGILRPGDRLPTERELVAQLRVSRSSVREALRALDLMGMVESRVKEGTFIKDANLDMAMLTLARTGPIDEVRIRETYQVRAQLEVLSAGLAARNRTEADLARMREAVEAMAADIALGGRGQTADEEFHRAVATASGNSVLRGILAMCLDVIRSSIHTANAHANVNILVKEHRRIQESLEKGDAKRAERLMREHIRRAYERSRFIAERLGGV